MESLENMSNEEKIGMLEYLESSEEGYFSNYSDSLSVLAKDPNPEIRIKAIECLWEYPSKDCISLLFDILESETNPGVRAKLVSGLGRYIFELEDDELFRDDEMFEKMALEEDVIPRDDLIRVKQYLTNTFRDETKSLDERRFALEGLGFSSDDAVQGMVEEAYASEEKMMRISAIFAMGRSGLTRWEKTLVAEVGNPDRDIQMEAIRACGNSAIEKAGKKILQLTHSGDREILLASAWALGQTGWKEGFERLDKLSSSKDKEIRETAEAALEEWFVANGDSEGSNDFDE
jgi:HEAT repeat protein